MQCQKLAAFLLAVYDETVPPLQNPNHNRRTKRIVIRVYCFVIKLWFKVYFFEIWRIEEIRNVDTQALAYLVDHAQLYRVIGAIDDISNRGLGHAAFNIKLILRHIPLSQELFQAGTDRLV